MSSEFESFGKNESAPFMLRVHRGDRMALLAMSWRKGKPPADFVGFGIEYRAPGSKTFQNVLNRISFPQADGTVSGVRKKSLEAPIQKFRWVNFPSTKIPPGKFMYRVTAMFMDTDGKLRKGEKQTATIALSRETCPGQLNVSFAIEGLRIFDHYQFRVAQLDSKKAKRTLSLKQPPRIKGDQAWWEPYYSNPVLIRDRKLFS